MKLAMLTFAGAAALCLGARLTTPAPSREAARPSAVLKRPAPPPPTRPEPARPPASDALYEKGVDLYARGRLREAAVVFEDMLKADPKNRSAARALTRVRKEIRSGEP